MANELIIVTKSGYVNVGAKLFLNGLFAAQALMTETSTNVYVGSVPVPLLTGVPGEFAIGFYRNIGLPNEQLIGSGVVFWDGNKEVDSLDINTTLTKDGTGRII